MINKIHLTLLSLFISASALLGQEPVESPQRGTTYASGDGEWYSQPFVWIGGLIVLLVVVLLFLRKGQTPVNKPNPR